MDARDVIIILICYDGSPARIYLKKFYLILGFVSGICCGWLSPRYLFLAKLNINE
jgi:hypothetical protein